MQSKPAYSNSMATVQGKWGLLVVDLCQAARLCHYRILPMNGCLLKFTWQPGEQSDMVWRYSTHNHNTITLIGIAEVMGSNPVQAWIFSTTAQVMHITARINFIHVFIRSSNIWLSYILNSLQLPMSADNTSLSGSFLRDAWPIYLSEMSLK